MTISSAESKKENLFSNLIGSVDPLDGLVELIAALPDGFSGCLEEPLVFVLIFMLDDEPSHF